MATSSIETRAHRTSDVPQAVHAGAFISSGFMHCALLPIEITLVFPMSLLPVIWGRINTTLERAGPTKSSIYHDCRDFSL